ncbi:tyrosine-type recombinase/integrase [Peribacillus frigoritolerans]|uniref:tyrosine-type recombinase/integrase n=1 Tax=Peribacillus frigoritolerans TaxID=450367 RepID=UPI0037FFD841
MAKTVIKQRGKPLKERKLTSKATESFTIEYTLQEALDIFLRAKVAEGVRQRTLGEYVRHIRYLTEYLSVYHPSFKHVSDLTPALIRDYITFSKNKKAYSGDEKREKNTTLSLNTINIRLRTLRTMCKFWFEEGITPDNPMKNIKNLKLDAEEEVKGFSDDEVTLILNYFNERNFGEWRDKLLVLLLLDTGMRINEAISTKISNMDFKESSIFIPPEINKNRKGRHIPVSREVMRELRKLHDECIGYFGDHETLFMNAYGEPLTGDTIRRRLYKVGTALGIPKVHPHRFRHTFIRNYILNGGDLFTLQKIVDHSNITTTRKYIQLDDVHIRDQHNKFSPVRKYMKRNR